MDAYSSGTVTAADGIRLAYRVYSPSHQSPGSLPVICLPGLTRNARDFHEIANMIACDPIKPRKVICLDYRGRGKSDRAADTTTYNVVSEAQDTLHVLDSLQIPRGIFIGTSRGGLILHVMAQMALDRIDALVLNDVGPELGIEGLAQIQAYLSKTETKPLTGWQAAEIQLAETHGPDFPALTVTDWRDWAKAIYVEEAGRLVADCDPAIALAFTKVDLSQPLPNLWQQFELLAEKPTLVIRGEHSRLLTKETVSAMAGKHRQLQVVTATGQGHAPILHKQQVSDPLIRYLQAL